MKPDIRPSRDPLVKALERYRARQILKRLDPEVVASVFGDLEQKSGTAPNLRVPRLVTGTP